MNRTQEILRINDRELELGLCGTSGSWHAEYRGCPYIFVGGLSFQLTEGDLAVCFSQFGELFHCRLVRDKETGESKGFAFLGYDDVRSCVLAVDNFNGVKLAGRMISVDHAANYEPPEEEEEEDEEGEEEEEERQAAESASLDDAADAQSKAERKQRHAERKARKEERRRRREAKQKRRAERAKRKQLAHLVEDQDDAGAPAAKRQRHDSDDDSGSSDDE